MALHARYLLESLVFSTEQRWQNSSMQDVASKVRSGGSVVHRRVFRHVRSSIARERSSTASTPFASEYGVRPARQSMSSGSNP